MRLQTLALVTQDSAGKSMVLLRVCFFLGGECNSYRTLFLLVFVPREKFVSVYQIHNNNKRDVDS